MAINGRTYSDAQNRAMDAAMLHSSPADACRRAAAGTLEDPDTGAPLPAFTYNTATANVRKRRSRRAAESRARAELPAIAQLQGAATELAGIAHELAAKAARKHRAGRLTAAELRDTAAALRETHRAVLPLLAPASSSSREEKPAEEESRPAPVPAIADPEVASWAEDAAAGA
jgi:hypothetical protein